MADFNSPGWSLLIIIVTVISIVACFWLAMSLSSKRVDLDADGRVGTTGHVWDEDLVELNHPLPRWWLYLFYITCIFGMLYLVLYPGMGAYQGLLGWSQENQYEREVAKVDARVQPLFARFKNMPIQQIAGDDQAVQMGESLYLTYCIQCHGSDARGARGIPNLTDNDWLGAGGPDYILNTILKGRQAAMPAMAAAIGGAANVEVLAHYVLSLSGSDHVPAMAQKGESLYAGCSACHGPKGEGNTALGAPNLTDHVWLHGSGAAAVKRAINNGINNQMPAFDGLIDEGRARVLAAYVLSLSKTGQPRE